MSILPVAQTVKGVIDRYAWIIFQNVNTKALNYSRKQTHIHITPNQCHHHVNYLYKQRWWHLEKSVLDSDSVVWEYQKDTLNMISMLNLISFPSRWTMPFCIVQLFIRFYPKCTLLISFRKWDPQARACSLSSPNHRAKHFAWHIANPRWRPLQGWLDRWRPCWQTGSRSTGSTRIGIQGHMVRVGVGGEKVIQ